VIFDFANRPAVNLGAAGSCDGNYRNRKQGKKNHIKSIATATKIDTAVRFSPHHSKEKMHSDTAMHSITRKCANE
jgi:hypothetical protein